MSDGTPIAAHTCTVMRQDGPLVIAGCWDLTAFHRQQATPALADLELLAAQRKQLLSGTDDHVQERDAVVDGHRAAGITMTGANVTTQWRLLFAQERFYQFSAMAPNGDPSAEAVIGSISFRKPQASAPVAAGGATRPPTAAPPNYGANGGDYPAPAYAPPPSYPAPVDLSKPVHVNGYTRKDGTYVHEHTRNSPHR